MTWKLFAGFAVPWAVAAILGALMALASGPAEDGAYGGLINRISNPEAVGIDQPTVGSSNTPIGTTWELANQAVGWLSFMANAALLNYEFFQGDLAFIRYMMLALSAPLMFLVTKETALVFSNFVGGIFGRSG